MAKTDPPDKPPTDLRGLLLKPRPRRIEPVTIPTDYPATELAGQVYYVRALTAREKGAFDAQFLNRRSGRLIQGKARKLRLLLVIETVCNAEGTPVFSAEDLDSLEQVDVGLIDLLVAKAQQLNSIDPTELDDDEKK